MYVFYFLCVFFVLKRTRTTTFYKLLYQSSMSINTDIYPLKISSPFRFYVKGLLKLDMIRIRIDKTLFRIAVEVISPKREKK